VKKAESPDVEEMASGDSELEIVRRESAGKDRRITQLQAQIRELEAERGELLDQGDINHDRQAQFAEHLGALSELEKQIEKKAEAYQYAKDHGLDIDFTLMNADNLEQFKEKVGDIYNQIAAGQEELHRRRAREGGSQMKRFPQRYKPDGITLSQLGKMSQSEIARIPDSVLDRLHEEAR